MTRRDRTDLDTGAKPGHAMLPDMGSYQLEFVYGGAWHKMSYIRKALDG